MKSCLVPEGGVKGLEVTTRNDRASVTSPFEFVGKNVLQGPPDANLDAQEMMVLCAR